MLVIFLILLNLIRIYSYLLLGVALLSWFPGAYQTSLGRLLLRLTAPLLRPLRKLHFQFAGLDFTVLLAFFLLNVLTELLYHLINWMI